MNNILSKLSAARLVLMTLLFGSAFTAHAEESVYISDFGIKAGEQLEIAVNFDADASGFKYLEGNIQLPAGLKLVEDAYGKNLRARCDETRAKDGKANMNPETGDIIIASTGEFSGTKGAVGYITVVSTRDLKEVSKINLSGFKAVKADGTEVSIPDFVTTVTRTTPLAWLQFVKDAQTMKSGETVAVEVEMTNVVDITFVQANLTVSEGLKIVEVKPSDRVQGVSHNNTDVYIFSGVDADKKGSIVTGKGTIFTITVAADKNFAGNAWVYVKKTVATDDEAVTYKPADIALPVTVEAAFEPLFADGKYYLKNVATGKFLAAGHSWGTQAIVNKDGLDYTFAFTPEGKYNIDSQVANNATNHFLGSNLYNDSPAFGWTVAEVSKGVYTLSDGKQFAGIDENDNLAWTAEASDSAKWQLVTYEERVKELPDARMNNPKNATFVIQDANFSRNDQRKSAWTETHEGIGFSFAGGENENMAAEAYVATYDLRQTVTGLPNGLYKVEAQGAVTFHDDRVIKEYDGNGYPVIFANDKTSNFNDMVESDRLTNMNQICKQFMEGLYEVEPIMVEVTDGTLTVGTKSERNDIWAMWDNFRVTYLGLPQDVADGTYYLQHVATGKFLAAGHSWGTQAIVNEDGLDFTLTMQNDGKYVLDSKVANNATNHFLGDNLYTDSPAFAWTIAQVRDNEGCFTLGNGEKNVTIDENGNAAWSEESNESVMWKFVTYEERVKALEKASKVNPLNATFVIQDANFNRNDQRKSAWTETHEGIGFSFAGGENENMAAEAYVATYDLRQTVTGLPNGLYKVEAQGAVTFHDDRVIKEYDGNGYPVIFANDKTSNFNDMVESDRLTNMNQICKQFMEGLYEVEPIMVEVTDGTLTVGTKSERNDIWAMWDNFRVTYLGPVPSEEELAEAPAGWHSVISNGNLAQDENVNFYTKESGGAPVIGTIVAGAGKNNGNGLMINTPDNPGTEWDAQFFIKSDEIIPAGHKIHVEFDYMATQEAGFDTQSHAQPSDYIHWYCVGSGNATPVWQHYSAEVEVSKAKDDGSGDWGKACTNPDNGKPFQTVAFNLCKVKTATTFFFDNIIFWVSDVDVAVKDIKVINAETGDIYDLRGRKVEGALRKGVYIQNGKKVLVK